MADGPVKVQTMLSAERRIILVLLSLYALAYLDRQIITLLLDPIGKDLGASDVDMGFLQGFGFVLFFALCGPLVGWMVDRHARRQIIWAGVTVWSLFTAGGGLANTYHELLFARFGVGAGEAALLPAAYSMISDIVDKSRLGKAMAVFSLGAIIGSSLSYGLGGAIVGLAGQFDGITLPLIGAVRSWQLVFLCIGTAGLPLALTIFTLPEPVRQVRSQAAIGADSGHFRRHWRFYVCHITGFSLLCLVSSANVAWSATYIGRTYGWRVQEIGGVLAAISLLGGGLGMLGSGTLADWLFKRGYRDAHLRIYVGAAPIMALAAIVAYSSISITWTLIGLAILAIGSPFIAVAAAALQLGTPPERRGVVSATFLMIYNLVGFGLGPALVALVSRQLFAGKDIGAAMALTFSVVCPLVVVMLLLGFGAMRGAVQSISGDAGQARTGS